MDESSLSLDSCRITNTLGDCLNLIESSVSMDHTTLAQFYPFSAERGVALRFDENSMVICDNSLVTGYDEDVVMGGGTNFFFENCILRTLKPADLEDFVDVIFESPKDEIQGDKHFKVFDTDNLFYNFSIKEESPAFGKKIGDLRNL
jgi:hypothetical protein